MNEKLGIFLKVILSILCVALLTFISVNYINNQQESREERHNFYEEWCPKLNSTVLPFGTYGYEPMCYREIGDIVKRYRISNISGEYKLRELTNKN